MPMTVRHIQDAEQSAEGIRYLLKRPSYELVLVVNNKEELKKVEEDACIRAGTFEAVLKQELSGEPELYEVGGPDLIGAIANVFADTNLTVTLDDSGQLVSVEAGATDKSLEFVQAVAGLAVSLAKKAAVPAPGAVSAPAVECFIDVETQETDTTQKKVETQKQKAAIQKYANRHLALLEHRDFVRDALKKSFDALPDAGPTSREKILEAITLLRTEQTQVQAALNEIGYAVPPNDYCLLFDDNPDPKSERWLRIDPKSGGEIDREGGGEFDPKNGRAVDACDTNVPFKIKLRRAGLRVGDGTNAREITSFAP